MLEELSVRNFALIESLNINFEKGLSILTGETGAGKSIIVGSLSFLLGAKADSAMIRTGSEEASVSAVITLNPKNKDALEWLKEHDIETEDEIGTAGSIIVRRTIKTNGRSSIFIQNENVTRSALAEFMGFLFDIHGQHEHESLLHKENHRRYLDRFAALEAEAHTFNNVFLQLADKRKMLESSIANERERDKRIELLNFSIDEINAAALKIGESKELDAESKRLVSFEKLAAHIDNTSHVLCDSDNSVLNLARKAKTAMENAATIDTSLSALQQRIENLFYEAEDISGEFRTYRDSLSFDPDRLEAVEERLAMLFKLKKKYCGNISGTEEKSTEEEILAYKNNAQSEIDALQSSEQDRENLKAEIARLEKDIALKAAQLTSKRKAAAAKLSERISGTLAKLGMSSSVFSVTLEAKSPHDKTETPSDGGKRILLGPWGADEIEFLISANVGEAPRELGRIASGGELSRVMLAIKTALILDDEEKDTSNSGDTLIFDEIDTGIGGEVALAVGQYLKMISVKKQIFCITHLASIAVRADNHLKVEKTNDGKRTTTQLVKLQQEDRRAEIARMLSGDKGETALAHADDLLKKYGGA
ncbi:MAG: DNA repair protein RecN [Termitinemataceae bacterium]|nr:MAG: DNA repair protein RecN [Termitinemataceae bacterium]